MHSCNFGYIFIDWNPLSLLDRQQSGGGMKEYKMKLKLHVADVTLSLCGVTTGLTRSRSSMIVSALNFYFWKLQFPFLL
jgi:hypothetical protein